MTQDVENYIRIPPMLNQRYGGEMIAFFAAEAKASTIAVPLEGHLPQVLLELVACAKHLGYVAISTSIPFRSLFCVGNLIFVVLSRPVSNGISS